MNGGDKEMSVSGESQEEAQTGHGQVDMPAITGMRVALGVTYVWFGALKLAGVSPVADLVKKTSLFIPDKAAVPLVGAWEVTVGLGLLTRVALRPTLILFFLQIASTFLALLLRPGEAFRKGNPLLLTERGEFIVKNLVLLAAGITIASAHRKKSVLDKA